MKIEDTRKATSDKTAKNNGFSLFEILIVVVIFAIVVFIANQSFVSSLRSGTKSDLQQRVKSNSNYIFSVMERQLHSSRKVTQCKAATGSTDIGTGAVSTQIQYNDSNNVAQTFSFVANNNGTFTSTALGQLNSPDVALTAASITCDVTNAVTTINVNLTLKQAGATAGLRPEEQDTFQAQTKITLRNN
jgi:prepilin-type N-terminal cleavage/methylation domain-containing protein